MLQKDNASDNSGYFREIVRIVLFQAFDGEKSRKEAYGSRNSGRLETSKESGTGCQGRLRIKKRT